MRPIDVAGKAMLKVSSFSHGVVCVSQLRRMSHYILAEESGRAENDCYAAMSLSMLNSMSPSRVLD